MPQGKANPVSKATKQPALSPDTLLESGQLLRELERTLAELAEFTAHLRGQVIETRQEDP